MALETWLIKVKTAISHSFETSTKPSKAPNTNKIKPYLLTKSKKSSVGVLAFEIASLMSKLLHLWQSLSDANVISLHNQSITLEGVRKIVSNDESFLLGLACAEIAENVRLVGKSISRLSKRCEDLNLSSFDELFDEFANYGHDPRSWVLNSKEMEARNNKMDRYVTLTATLYKEMEELTIMENGLRKSLQSVNHELETNNNNNNNTSSKKEQKIIDLKQKIAWEKQEIKYLKARSLWNRSYDTVVSMLARSVFTVLARTKLVFGFTHPYNNPTGFPVSLTRSLSASATVHPTENPETDNFALPVSGPLKNINTAIQNKTVRKKDEDEDEDEVKGGCYFFESNSNLLKPPTTTLGASALALHYANLIIVIEKMIKQPQLVGVDARDDLYGMLPGYIRSSLRDRLKGVGFSASDPVLAAEWRTALARILAWLSPLAHNMIKWQSERSFEQQNLLPKANNVLLLQTLFFANKSKTEAAITELLVGLNYIWRFEREMTAKALFECNNNFNGFSKDSS